MNSAPLTIFASILFSLIYASSCVRKSREVPVPDYVAPSPPRSDHSEEAPPAIVPTEEEPPAPSKVSEAENINYLDLIEKSQHLSRLVPSNALEFSAEFWLSDFYGANYECYKFLQIHHQKKQYRQATSCVVANGDAAKPVYANFELGTVIKLSQSPAGMLSLQPEPLLTSCKKQTADIRSSTGMLDLAHFSAHSAFDPKDYMVASYRGAADSLLFVNAKYHIDSLWSCQQLQQLKPTMSEDKFRLYQKSCALMNDDLEDIIRNQEGLGCLELIEEKVNFTAVPLEIY